MAADDSALLLRIREITETRVHYGYRRVHVMLRREGWRDNHKRIYRLYSEQGLSLRLKRPRRNKSAQRRQPQPQGLYPNHVWGMDFVSDALFDGRRLRLLTVIDLYTRECLGICVGQNLRSTEVAEMLNSIALVSPGSRQRDMSVQDRFLSLVASLQGTRDALTCSRVENESAAALRTELTRFGFSPEQLTTLLTMITWPIDETEEQQRLALATLLAELAARGIDGDREKLMTLVFSPVRRPEETWRGRLQWLLGSELAKGFRFGSPLTQQEAEPVLAWFEQTLGHPAMQVFCQAINWGIDGGEDNSGMVYQNKEHE